MYGIIVNYSAHLTRIWTSDCASKPRESHLLTLVTAKLRFPSDKDKKTTIVIAIHSIARNGYASLVLVVVEEGRRRTVRTLTLLVDSE
jgi:hypothetical protein